MSAINLVAVSTVDTVAIGRMNTSTHRYGCFNRKDHVTSYPAPDGHRLDGQTYVIKVASIKATAKRECQYESSDFGKDDPGCTDCNRKNKDPK